MSKYNLQIELPLEEAQAILEYLSQRPYREVAHLVAALQSKKAKEVESEDEAPV